MDKQKHTHEVIDTKTGAVVGTYSSAERARRARDRKDLEYGAIRYRVRSANGGAAVNV